MPGASHPHHYPLSFPTLRAQRLPGKRHSSDAAGEVVAIVGWGWVSMYKKYFFHNANSAPEEKKKEIFIVNYRDNLHSLPCKS